MDESQRDQEAKIERAGTILRFIGYGILAVIVGAVLLLGDWDKPVEMTRGGLAVVWGVVTVYVYLYSKQSDRRQENLQRHLDVIIEKLNEIQYAIETPAREKAYEKVMSDFQRS